MKILITGEPHIGKTTALTKIIANVKDKVGFITEEITLDNGYRQGFKLVASDGKQAILASVESESVNRVSRYGVDVEALDKFITDLPDPRQNTLLYIDAIGQMELFSENFKNYVINQLDHSNNFLGTITSIYNDEFIISIKIRGDIEIVHLTKENREVTISTLVKRLTSI